MRQLDAKMRVLMAIYAEYQKDVPDMVNVNVRALRMDWDAFRAAVLKLENEALIRGLVTKPPERAQIGDVEEIDMRGVMPTVSGLSAVERFVEKGQIDTAEARLERLERAAGDAGELEISRYVEDVMIDVKRAARIHSMRGFE